MQQDPDRVVDGEPTLAILHVINRIADHGGAEGSLVQLLPRLTGDGLRHAVLPLLGNFTTAPLRDHGVIVFPSPRKAAFRAIPHVRRAIRAFRPDLVHTTLYDADIAGRVAARLAGVPVLSSVVNMQYGDAAREESPSAWRLRAIRVLDGFLARRVNVAFHALTEATADAAVTALRIRRDRIFVVPRGRDRVALGEPSPARRARARSELGVDEKTPVILNVARLERQKGHIHLIEAFAAVARVRPTAVLVIAGRAGSASAEVAAAVERLAVSDRVRVLGIRHDIPELLCAADVFAFTSLYEGLGGAILEAMALQVPVVAFDIAPVREVLGGTGLLVPSRDVATFADAILKLLDEPDTAAAAATAARARFEACYTLDTVVAATRRMYAAVAARAGIKATPPA